MIQRRRCTKDIQQKDSQNWECFWCAVVQESRCTEKKKFQLFFCLVFHTPQMKLKFEFLTDDVFLIQVQLGCNFFSQEKNSVWIIWMTLRNWSKTILFQFFWYIYIQTKKVAPFYQNAALEKKNNQTKKKERRSSKMPLYHAPYCTLFILNLI